VRGLTLPLVLLAALTFLVGLGRGAITDADEAFYAEAAREMVESGNLLTPYFNYETRFQKPILYYWMTAATFVVTGPTEASARLWSALSGIGLVLITAACARRWYDDGVGLLAGAIVATSFGYYAIARMALPDLPLTFFITLTTWAGFVATLDGGRHQRGWVLLAAVGMALGFLTKGPVGVILPGLVVVPVVLMERRGLHLRGADVLSALVVFAVMALPWYGVMWLTHGTAYLDGFFLGDNLERFATDRFNDPRPWWFYGPVIMGGLLPWTPLALVWLSPVWRFLTRRKDIETLELRLVLWAALPVLFYSLSVGKQPRYILPVLPPLAILLAVSVLERTRDWRSLDGARVRIPRPGAVSVGAALTGVLLVALAALVWRAEPLLLNVSTAFTLWAAAAIALAGAAVLMVGLSSAWRQVPLAVTLAAAVTFTALQYGTFSGTGESTVEQVARAVQAARLGDEPIGTHQVFVRNLVYYSGLKTVDLVNEEALDAFLQQDQRVIVVTTEDAVARVEAATHRSIVRLATFSYFDEAGVRLRTLLWPDPSRDLHRVVVVTNRGATP
jgi:4-amino-4-deoxy-L-arabinose transferase-like glycosyltransferase